MTFLNYGENNEIYISFGLIKNFNENINFLNYFNNSKRSIIPILLCNSYKLIGFICSLSNKPILINNLISDFLLSYLDQIKINKITAIYKIEKDCRKIKIFHEDFIKINKDKCKIIIEKEKLIDLCSELILDDKLKMKKEIKIELIQYNIMTDLFSMFAECSDLISLPDIHYLNLDNVESLRSIFFHCSSLVSLPDISIWNTQNITNMKGIFNGCKSLISIPNISKWNTNKVTIMSALFCECSSLSYIPDISKWDIQNVTTTGSMFYSCNNLLSIPDISRWNTKNLADISSMFCKCVNLEYLPDLSEWNTDKLNSVNFLFCV